MFQFRNLAGRESEIIGSDTLLALVQAGVVTEETPVRMVPDGNWQPAWRVSDLQGAFGLSVPYLEPAGGNRPPAQASPSASTAPQRFETSVPVRKGPPPAVRWLAGLVALILLAAGVRGMTAGSVRTTRDGQMQVTFPAGWKYLSPDPDLELQSETDGGNTVVMVGCVELTPGDPEMTLEAFDFQLIQGTIRESDNFQDLGTRRYEANGLQFLRHDFRGTIRGQDGIFALVSTRARGSFYRMVAGTTPQLAASKKKALDAILLSLRER